MSLRIACDLDGTVADMDSALQREAQRLFGPDVALRAFPGDRLESAEDVEGRMMPGEPNAVPIAGPRALTPREIRRLWEHVTSLDNFWTSLGEVEPGALAQLATVSRSLRWEVIFLTQRPPSAGDTTQVQSQRWLKAHGFELPSVMVMRGSRGKVAEAFGLDALIDDRTENCLDVLSDSKAKPILIWRQGLGRVPPAIAGLPIEAVSSMADALAFLEGMTAECERGQTLVGRLKRALGRTP
jgi:hypothetical protein